MPQPGALSLGILACLNHNRRSGIGTREPSARELAHSAIASGFPCRCLVGHFLEQCLHFLHPASSEHGIRSRGDPIAERLPRVDDKIACPATRGTGMQTMQLR